MERNGDDLKIPRDIDFSVVFPTTSDAEDFAARIRRLGLRASVTKSDVVAELPWDVTVTKHLVPIHAQITEFEEMLEDLALALSGRNDGWGCFAQPLQH